MSMKDEHLADLSAFLAELARETDRGLPIVGAALIDEQLRRTLHAFLIAGKAAVRLINDGAAPLGTLSARADMCHALGLLDDFEFREISTIRKVRNVFAHGKHGLTFDEPKVGGLCATLESDLPKGPGIVHGPRSRLQNALVCIVTRLYYRPEWVERERRTGKEWLPRDFTRWRSVADEKPPEGTPVLAFGTMGRQGSGDDAA